MLTLLIASAVVISLFVFLLIGMLKTISVLTKNPFRDIDDLDIAEE